MKDIVTVLDKDPIRVVITQNGWYAVYHREYVSINGGEPFWRVSHDGLYKTLDKLHAAYPNAVITGEGLSWTAGYSFGVI